MRRQLWAPLLLVLLASAPAGAVLIASGDGTGNDTAPADDPGFGHVGTRSGLSAVYLGDRWVITAAHAGVGDVVLGGRVHRAEPGSELRLRNADESAADLVVFRLLEDPGLPSLEVARETPTPGSTLVLAGNGRNRGDAADWYGRPGWWWGPGRTLRWGSNVVSEVGAAVDTAQGTTRAFFTDFTLPGGTGHEAQAAPGDSGGACFARGSGGWLLAGVMVAVQTQFQPEGTALAGNLTYVADLAAYRPQLVRAGVLPADGEPRLELESRRLFLGWVRMGREARARLVLENDGSAPLTVHRLRFGHRASPDLELWPEPRLPLMIAPGGAVRLGVRFVPTRRGAHFGRLVIESDDPARPRVDVGAIGVGYRARWWSPVRLRGFGRD